jgi:hypothetical protein
MQIRKSLVAFVLTAMVALCATSFAAVPLPVVLTNDDNPNAGANTATAFHLNTSDGTMASIKVLETGGTGLGTGFFAYTGSAIASNGACVFVINTASDTISSFAAPSFAKTGDAGFSGMFSGQLSGGGVALSPNGKLLASANSGTLNVSTWKVATNCTLTHVGDYTPSIGADIFATLAFTPNGKALIVPSVDFEGAEIFQVNANGTLTDVNNVSWASLTECQTLGCFPTGLDITSDSRVVVFGNASGGQNSLLSVNIGPKGLTNPQNWPIAACPSGCGNPNVPWFSKNGAKGNGELYVGMSGYGINNIPSGEVTMNFTESPLRITEEGSGTFISTPQQALGAIRSVAATGDGTGGGMLVFAIYPNQIQTATIDAGGAITLGPVTADANGQGLLSISVYPNTR